MSIFDRLPRRAPKPHPHRAPRRPERLERVPVPVGMPGLDTAMYLPASQDETPAVRPVARLDVPAEFPPAEDPAMTAALEPLRAALAEAAPSPWATDADALRAVRDSLRALPADEPAPAPVLPGAYLRNVLPGTITGPFEPLNGFPSFAGVSRMNDGRPVVGLYLGDADDSGQLVLDVPDKVWLWALITAAEDALNVLDPVEAAPAAAEGTEAA